MSAERDAELHEGLLAGDDAALGAAYDLHAAAVHGTAARILRDPTAAEDVVQEVFVRLWERPEDFDPCRGRLRAWLCAAARHRSIDRLRRAEVQGRYLPLLASDVESPVDVAESAVADVVGKVVRTAVNGLPEPHRAALLLAYYGGLSYRQVAAELGIAEGTAKSRLRLALRLLAEKLAADGLTER
ncbi:MAG TPA: sigma-70 family RNA polymerase sigma factor [Micromonosporaceae bacterium]|nr:sigma-70 family RNA polymerase sigma factor [Micromonosporaceae bacterium]